MNATTIREVLEATRMHREAINKSYRSDFDEIDGLSDALDGMTISISKLESALADSERTHEAILATVNDFDQTGCSDDLGTVSVWKIGKLREVAGI